MPDKIRLTDFTRWFHRHGIEIVAGGKHLKMRGRVKGVEVTYPLPTLNGRYVKHLYLAKARKQFSLTADDGHPDEESCD